MSGVRLTFPGTQEVIARREDRTGYETSAGTMPSITRVIGETASPESKAALQTWLARPGAQRESAAACRRGTWMHEQVERHLMGQATENHLAFGGYLRNILPWVKENVVEPLAMEMPVFFPHGSLGAAGTFDLLAYCAHWQDVTLIDWKSSKRRRSADLVAGYMAQLGAYSLGLKHTYDIEPTKACLVIGRPTGSWPDVWILEHEDLLAQEQVFLERLDRYLETLDRASCAA
jgi:hypothetical protein